MQTISRLLVTYLANGLWITLLIAAAVGLIARLVARCSPATRHVLWVAALACASLLPLVTLANIENNRDFAASSSSADNVNAGLADAPQALSQRPFWLKIRQSLPPILFAPLVTGFLAIAYLGFGAYRALCLFWSWRRTRRVLDRASPFPLKPHGALLESCDSALKAARISLVRSDLVNAPSIVGFFRPVLVVPDWFVECSNAEIASALRHELAHVRRHDFLLNLVYEMFLLPLSFHPAAWLIKKRIDQTRELACDEIAAKQSAGPAVYARSLLSIAQQIAAHSTARAPSCALGLFDTNSLEERIMHLMEKKGKVSKARSWVRLALAGTVLAAICAAASLVSVQVALAAAPEDTARFAGTWQGKFKGKVFVTLNLAAKDEKVSGTVSRLGFQMDASGNVTSVSALEGKDEIVETSPQGNVLHLVTKAKGKLGGADASVQYDLTLSSEHEAELQVAGAPPGMPAPPPWKLERTTNPK